MKKYLYFMVVLFFIYSCKNTLEIYTMNSIDTNILIVEHIDVIENSIIKEI
ncbi:hypothetical protein [Aureivirga marina]|uniref:hypothetical protein n=1 Tax=Aureivirga marina TaxID=1182451 RepID=UPI0018C94619|nr:hypothetical protein [Aureivirga marina]